MKNKIIVYGVPGSGKTSVSLMISKMFHVPHMEADEIRKIAKEGKSAESDPFIFLPTTDAWKAFGAQTPESIIQGLLRVREAMRIFVDETITLLDGGYVLESAFLDPTYLKDFANMILITVPSEQRHRKQFFTHRTEDASMSDRFKSARIIQGFLISEADKLGLPILKNETDLESLASQAQAILRSKIGSSSE